LSEHRQIEKKITWADRNSSLSVGRNNAYNRIHLKPENGKINTDNVFGKLNIMQEI
jgi:hypothetical protein